MTFINFIGDKYPFELNLWLLKLRLHSYDF